MKIGIMQPYFFPYLGYLSLIKHTDKFILFDTVQFIRHGWIERNRILKPDGGWQYIQVPLIKFPQKTNIKDVKINNASDWKGKILAQIQHYKKKARYFNDTVNFCQEIFASEFDDIVSLNHRVLEKLCEYLGFKRKIEIFSLMDLPIEEVKAPDEWALNICKAIGNVSEYWNPPGGKSFFSKGKYEAEKIGLKFHTINISNYDQKQETFEPGLSIIDVMMFNNICEINSMLDQYVLD